MLLAGLLMCASIAMAQKQVSGIVVSSEDGEPVIGAAIQVKGANAGTVTDIDGHFHLVIPSDQNKISVTYIGMRPLELVAQSNMRITMEPEDKHLDEVVVVAYGTAKRQSITGAVSVVGEKELKGRVATSVTGALEGNAPGIQVNSTYGEPGEDPSIRIRGASTINGDAKPLYVVDGVPYDGNISEINPSDVASMSVLKDAASSALYGNRAANGVVLITTKKGMEGRPQITLDIKQGIYKRGMAEYERLGAKDWMEASWQAMKNYAISGGIAKTEAEAAQYASSHLIGDFARRNIFNGDSKALFDEKGNLVASQIASYDDLDWEDAIIQTGSRQEYNLSGRAGTEKLNVYASLGYTNEQGYIKGIGYERFSGMTNISFKPTKWLETGIKLNAVYANRSYNSSATETYSANPFYVTRTMAPIYPYYLHKDDGSYLLDANGDKQWDTTSSYLDNRNIGYELRNDVQRQHRATIDSRAFANVTLPYGFVFNFVAALGHTNDNRQQYNNPNIGDGASNNGRLSSTAYQYNTNTVQELLNWSHEFDIHHLDLMVGHENHLWSRRYAYAMNTDMVVTGNQTMGNFILNSSSEGSNDEYRTEGYLFRARYNYDEKYFVDASYRRDASSKFHPDHRWGDFFSFGLNWNAKKEKFLEKVEWLNALRARASYGEVGQDQAVSYYGYQALYNITKNGSTLGNGGALIRQTLAANDIKWETTQTIDLAIEGRVFDRVNFNLGYYDKRSKDLLFDVRLPLSAGSFPYFSEYPNLYQYKNIGVLSNHGVEFSADVDIIKKKGLVWNVGFDATFPVSTIKKLPEHKSILHDGYMIFEEGEDPYSYYTYHFEGVDQMTGNSLYTLDADQRASAESAGALVTINGNDYTTSTTYASRSITGNVTPDVYGGLNTSLSWKGISLSMLFAYSLGGKFYDGGYQTLMSTGSASSASALHKDVLDSWKGVPEGMTENSANRIDKNGTPILDFNGSIDNNAQSDRWLASASYLNFKNISLSYSLPAKWIAPLTLSSVNVSVGAENLFILTARQGFNPMVSFKGKYDDTYVSARVFNLGVSINF